MTHYGPFHRIAAPKQTLEDALKQKRSSEIWGKPIVGSGLVPRVKAYLLPLCAGEPPGNPCANERGIEFTTRAKPSVKAPSGLIYWEMKTDPTAHMRKVDDETIAIEATIYKLVYEELTELGKPE